MTFPSPTFVNVTVQAIITGPTAAPGTNSTQLASTAFVQAAAGTAVFSSPPPIGSVAPNTGAFTTLSATSTISGAGFTAWAASPPAIGSTVPGTGAFTTLAASSTVSGAGFDAYLASGKPGSFSTLAASGAVSGAGFTSRFSTPGPIGDGTPSTGSFSTLAASGVVSGAGFTARLATPGPIGNTVASTGAFTTLSATGLISPTSTIGVQGTTTNDSTQAGSVGEFISATVLVGSAVALTSNTATNITSISLTAGDWDVSGNVFLNPAGGTVLNQFVVWVSSTSAATPTAPNQGGEQTWNGSLTGLPLGFGAGPMRFSLSGTTTIFLSTLVVWTTAQPGAYGFIRARRIR
jgi:hypothetical protein